jgi:hypothetical protein
VKNPTAGESRRFFDDEAGESVAWIPFGGDPISRGGTARIYTDEVEWCLMVEPLDGQWRWEAGVVSPVGPYLEGLTVLHEGDADSLGAAQAAAIKSVHDQERAGGPQ